MAVLIRAGLRLVSVLAQTFPGLEGVLTCSGRCVGLVRVFTCNNQSPHFKCVVLCTNVWQI